MTRRKESCLGCGQMLVAVPAGGGWAHLSLALPVSLFSTVEKATDGVRRFCSSPSSASSSVQLSPYPGPKAPCQGNMGTAPGTQPSTGTRVNCLQRGVAPSPLSPTNTLLPPRGCEQQLHVRFWSPGGTEAFLSDTTCPLKVSQRFQLWNRGQWGRDAKLDMLWYEAALSLRSTLDVWWCMWTEWWHDKWSVVKVKGSCQNPKVPKSITGWLSDLCVTGVMMNQCMRSLKKRRELIRDLLRSEPPTPAVLDPLLTSCSFVCNNTHISR